MALYIAVSKKFWLKLKSGIEAVQKWEIPKKQDKSTRQGKDNEVENEMKPSDKY